MAITQQQFDEEVLRSLISAADQARKVGLDRAKLYFRAHGAGLAREVSRLRARTARRHKRRWRERPIFRRGKTTSPALPPRLGRSMPLRDGSQ